MDILISDPRERSNLWRNTIFKIVVGIELRIAAGKGCVEIERVDRQPGHGALDIPPGSDGQGSLVEYAGGKTGGG